jgi:hypothetical protein
MTAIAAAAQSAGADITVIDAVVAITLLVGGFFAATVTYFIRRRATTGKVSTSDADVLWKQSQAMRDMLLKEKEMAESQRDKMIEINGQILPMLDSINNSLVDIYQIVRRGNGTRESGVEIRSPGASRYSGKDRQNNSAG